MATMTLPHSGLLEPNWGMLWCKPLGSLTCSGGTFKWLSHVLLTGRPKPCLGTEALLTTATRTTAVGPLGQHLEWHPNRILHPAACSEHVPELVMKSLLVAFEPLTLQSSVSACSADSSVCKPPCIASSRYCISFLSLLFFGWLLLSAIFFWGLDTSPHSWKKIQSFSSMKIEASKAVGVVGFAMVEFWYSEFIYCYWLTSAFLAGTLLFIVEGFGATWGGRTWGGYSISCMFCCSGFLFSCPSSLLWLPMLL